jgi:uncharacterized protein involved in tolerance to divalent cations
VALRTGEVRKVMAACANMVAGSSSWRWAKAVSRAARAVASQRAN